MDLKGPMHLYEKTLREAERLTLEQIISKKFKLEIALESIQAQLDALWHEVIRRAPEGLFTEAKEDIILEMGKLEWKADGPTPEGHDGVYLKDARSGEDK